jgi:hypothetical protein
MRRVALEWLRRSEAIADTRGAPCSGRVSSSFASDAHAALSPLGTMCRLRVIGKRVGGRSRRARASR